MIWLPEYAGELLLVTIDPSQSDDAEWEGMEMVNQAGYHWLDGQVDTGTYFDMLEHVGIDPVEFVGEFENYLFGITNNLTVAI